VPGASWRDCNWWTLCINSTHYQEYTVTTGKKTIISDNVKADYAIPIEFIGFDQGKVSVNSTGNVVLNSSINNRNGDTSITSAGSIRQNGDVAVVSGTNIDLRAGTGIGMPGARRFRSTRVAASSTPPPIPRSPRERGPGRSQDRHRGGAGVSNVFVEAERNLLGGDTGSYVQGKRVELSARNGSIGELGAATSNPLVVKSGYSTDQSQWPNLGLKATAAKTSTSRTCPILAMLALYSGNLLLISAEAASGDVRVETTGKVIDNIRSPPPISAPCRISRICGMRCGCAGRRPCRKPTSQIAAFENGKTQNYRLYWLIRERQADPSVYDPGFQYQVTPTERAVFTAQGKSAAISRRSKRTALNSTISCTRKSGRSRGPSRRISTMTQRRPRKRRCGEARRGRTPSWCCRSAPGS
jgi:hypothetical protein